VFSIITDSSAYFTRQEAESLGVRVLPLLYSVDGKQFTEGHSDENGQYQTLIAQGKVLHTAQVSGASYLSAFSELLRKGGEVLCLTISSRLSGAYSSAMMAARELGFKGILVVDSLLTAGGLKFLAEAASELSRKGCSIHEAADALESMRERVGIAFSVEDMEALRKSGRLGFVRQSVGTMLNLRPILHCKHGTVISAGVARGRHAQVAELVRSIPAEAKRIEVHYILNRTAADALRQGIQKRFACDVTLSVAGPVLGIHLGLNAIGVSWML
jgi:DegV family protein with EDD domain